jgi:hypothetical protein
MLGPEQERWLRGQLSDTQARWKVIGQQIVVVIGAKIDGPLHRTRRPRSLARHNERELCLDSLQEFAVNLLRSAGRQGGVLKMKRAGLLFALLILTSGVAYADGCPMDDFGYPWSWGHILFNKQAGSTAYCRVVGNRPNWFIRCTVSTNNTCKNVDSKTWTDMGYEGTQYWTDINDDGNIDFCREVGNPPNTFIRCIMGPTFESER